MFYLEHQRVESGMQKSSKHSAIVAVEVLDQFVKQTETFRDSREVGDNLDVVGFLVEGTGEVIQLHRWKIFADLMSDRQKEEEGEFGVCGCVRQSVSVSAGDTRSRGEDNRGLPFFGVYVYLCLWRARQEGWWGGSNLPLLPVEVELDPKGRLHAM